jgi:hypothetical protein
MPPGIKFHLLAVSNSHEKLLIHLTIVFFASFQLLITTSR